MAKSNETLKTLFVATGLCFICSVIVSITVVQLRPQQKVNAVLDFKKNVLSAAGIYDPDKSIDEQFEKIETIMVDLKTGETTDAVDAASFDQIAASKKPETSVKIPKDKDVGGLAVRAKYAKVFLVKEEGKIVNIILPIKSMGLWAVMYGFVALGPDTNTVKGFAYYKHGETPGLGAEVDNPKWKNQWVGKEIYNDEGKVVAGVVKNITKPDHQVDALSGATITSNGVDSSLEYWFGSHGYKKFLDNIKKGVI